MAGNNPPKQPNPNTQGDKKDSRIASIVQQISEPLRGLYNQFVALVNEIHANHEANETSQKKYQDSSLRWVKRGTVWSIALAVLNFILSGVVSIILWNQLHAQRIDQRAWIKIEHVLEEITENKPLWVKIHVTNTGKTPAKRVDGLFWLQKVASQASPNFASPGGAHQASFTGILLPSSPINVRAARFTEQTPDIFNPPNLTKSDVEDIKYGRAYIAIFGKVTYFDIFDIPHWITFCGWEVRANGNYSAMECAEYNNIDKN